jgi:hypothetical protein
MSGVFRIIDPPPSHRPASVYPPRFWCGGRTHSLGEEGVGGSIVRKTPNTALYTVYVSTLWTAPISRPDIIQLATEQQQALQATL